MLSRTVIRGWSLLRKNLGAQGAHGGRKTPASSSLVVPTNQTAVAPNQSLSAFVYL